MSVIIKDIDGNEHELSYTIGALKCLQQKTGLKGLQPLIKRLQDVGDANDLGAMVWAGLLYKNRDLKIEDVDWMFDGLVPLMMAVATAIQGDMPKAENARPTKGK